MKKSKKETLDWLDGNSGSLEEMALDIWDNPEVGLREEYASERQIAELKEEGFVIQTGIGGMETAFAAEYGNEGPVVGILGEYDALPGLSQRVKASREPVKEGAAGHGCGHNLLGTAGLGAALALKERIDRRDLEGSVRYYGCPAEETLVGKVFMVRDGAFDDLDACICWHPSGINSTWTAKSLAMNSVRFEFRGTSAHAAADPEQGRSALDAVELMNSGVEYMREHISDDARIHYSIPEGGNEPNIVPGEAVAWYYVRAPEREKVDFLYSWIEDIARGAAKMARVDLEKRFLSGCYSTLTNEVLADRILENLMELGGPDFAEEDFDFAENIEDTFNPGQKESLKEKGAPEELTELTLHEGVVEEHYDRGQVSFGSTDVGDVSWIAPLAQFNAATWPVGTAGHSWQATASAGSGIGIEGMLFASKVMAGTIVDLFEDPALIDEAKSEFERKSRDEGYVSPLPEEVDPPYDQLD